MRNGPSSVYSPPREEQPGPPLNQNTTGISSAFMFFGHEEHVVSLERSAYRCLFLPLSHVVHVMVDDLLGRLIHRRIRVLSHELLDDSVAGVRVKARVVVQRQVGDFVLRIQTFQRRQREKDEKDYGKHCSSLLSFASVCAGALQRLFISGVLSVISAGSREPTHPGEISQALIRTPLAEMGG